MMILKAIKRESKAVYASTPFVILLMGLLLISFFPMAPFSGPSEVLALEAEANSEETPKITRFQRKSVTIKAKTRKRIMTSTYSEFGVTTGVLIYGPDGKEVSLEDLLVPCEAEVVYMRENGKMIAKRINVKQIGPDATTLLLPDGEIAE